MSRCDERRHTEHGLETVSGDFEFVQHIRGENIVRWARQSYIS